MKGNAMKIVCASLLLLAGLCAPAIAAAQECPGTLIGAKAIRQPNGTKIGEVQLYWNAATKKNCARTMHGGPTWGKALRTDLMLATCLPSNFRDGRCIVYERATATGSVYQYQAGPVALPGQNRCVETKGSITLGNGSRYSARVAGHCR